MTKICGDCWHIFTKQINCGKLVDDLEPFKKHEGEEMINDFGEVRKLRLINSELLTQEEFEFLKQNKDKFYFIGQRKAQINNGFTNIGWA